MSVFSLTTSFLLGVFSAVSGQASTQFIKEHAVRFNHPDRLNDSVYNLLSAFEVMLIGELHGTNEPAGFVIGLAELFAGKCDSVQIGLEIPSGQMIQYTNDPSDSNIFFSDFFRKNSTDGRASEALASLISKLNENPKVRIFFYDVNKGDYGKIEERDSIMYLKVKREIRNHLGWKTVLLSGNVHVKLGSHKGKPTLAYYLRSDPELNISNKICSLNHFFHSGTMFNNSGNGLELKHVENASPDYSEVGIDNYLFLFAADVAGDYSGIFYTKNITAAVLTDYR